MSQTVDVNETKERKNLKEEISPNFHSVRDVCHKSLNKKFNNF